MPTTMAEWTGLVTAVGVPVLIGLLIDALAIPVLRRWTSNKGWKVAHEVAVSCHGLATVSGLVVSFTLALNHIEFTPERKASLHKWATSAWIVVGTIFATRLVGKLVRLYTERETTRLPSSSIFVNVARAIVLIVGGLTLLAQLGVSIAPLITALGVGGLAVGLALQDTLANLFAGLQILAAGQITPGDFIRLESGEEGVVQDVTWRETTIRTLSNDTVIIPNAVLSQSRVTNYTSTDTAHVVWIPVGVAYGSDLELVERVTLEEAGEIQRSSEHASSDYQPLFRYTGFGDSSIDLQVSVRARSYSDRFPLRHAVLKALNARFAEEDIEIPFPQRTVHLPGTANTGEMARSEA